MAFNSIPSTWISVGKSLKQSLFQYIKDNFDALYAAIFGISNSDIPNGSFEIDSDLDGIADSWTQNLYPGGSASLDATDRMIGTQSLRQISPGGSGNGGAYHDSDYVPCSVNRSVFLRFAHKASAAGMHNQVILRWFTAAKAYISATTIYDDTTTNPTSWTQFIRGATPVATACYFTVRLVGGNSDDATGGTARWDDVGLSTNVITVVGSATGTNATTTSAHNNVYIDGVLASPGMGISPSPAGAATGIAGGRAVDITAREGSGIQGTLSLTLPAGVWSIFASSDSQLASTEPDGYTYAITAMAIREG